MSFTHHTIVGHFDPETLNPSDITPMRPLDRSVVEALLEEYPITVREHVEWRDGYVQCCWADDFRHEIGKLVYEFAHKLAERQDCVAAELPFCLIEYPPAAQEIQQRIFEEYRQQTEDQQA